jgi:hypothetical protein
LFGRPFWPTLPRLDGQRLEWHPQHGLHRGFAWGLFVRDMTTFLDEAPRLFEIAPIGQLHLPAATLDQWRRFARADWLPRVRSIHFYGISTPVEPVRVLCEVDRANRLEEIVFEASGGPGMPDLLGDLLSSPTGQRLRSLELRVGPDSILAAEELYGALAQVEGGCQLNRLALVTLSAGDLGLRDLFGSRLFNRVTHLELVHIPGSRLPSTRSHLAQLHSIRAIDCGLDRRELDRLFHRIYLPTHFQVRALDLSENPIGEWPRGRSGLLSPPPGIRSFCFRRTGLSDRAATELTQMWFWSDLVELDLRDNGISNRGVLDLLDAPRPRELTALLLDGNPITSHMADRLRGHYGKCVSFGD